MVNNVNRKETKNILYVKARDENVLETITDLTRYTLKETIGNNKGWLKLLDAVHCKSESFMRCKRSIYCKESDHHDPEQRLSSRRCQKCLITILLGYRNRIVSDSDKMNVILKGMKK